MGISWQAVAEWRDALRSGKYAQTRNRLRNKDGYCCLGVFCEAVAKIEAEPFSFNEETGEITLWEYNGTTATLPELAQDLLTGENPKIFSWHLSALNDLVELSFDEIADLLDIAILEHEAGVPDEELIT